MAKSMRVYPVIKILQPGTLMQADSDGARVDTLAVP